MTHNLNIIWVIRLSPGFPDVFGNIGKYRGPYRHHFPTKIFGSGAYREPYRLFSQKIVYTPHVPFFTYQLQNFDKKKAQSKKKGTWGVYRPYIIGVIFKVAITYLIFDMVKALYVGPITVPKIKWCVGGDIVILLFVSFHGPNKFYKHFVTKY